MFQELRHLLASGDGRPLDAEDLLDVLWLAARVPTGPAAPLALGVGHRTGSAPDTEPGPTDPGTPSDPSTGDGPAPDGGHAAAGTEPVRQAPYIGVTSGHSAAGASGTAVWTPGTRALGSALPLGRTLRPLKRRTPSRHRSELDEVATATLQAETPRTPQMVMRPQPERWLRLALVIDGGVSMLLWERHCAELKGIFERSGAFRQVETCQIHYGPQGAVRLGRPWTTAVATRPASAVGDAFGQTMVLVVTDGAAAAWRDGRMRPVLERWARKGPTAVVHTLPRRLWAGSGVRADTWQVTSPRPGAPNRSWKVTHPLLPPSVAPAPLPPMPVLELSPSGLATWAAVNTVIGRSFPVPLWTPPDPVSGRADRPGRVSAQDFGRAASPEAVRLAAHLAAVAPVTVPVMQLVHACLDQGQNTAALAEVLLGGLVQPLPVPEGSQSTGRHRLFDFTDEAKDLLLDAVPTAELVECGRRVGRRIESLVGRSSDFPAWPVHPGSHRDRPGAQPFAYLGPALQARLGLPVAAVPSADAAAPVLPSPSGPAGEGGEPSSDGDLRERLRQLFDLDVLSEAFAADRNLSLAALGHILKDRAAPQWDVVLASLESMQSRLVAGPEMRGRLLGLYIDVALASSREVIRRPYEHVRAALRSHGAPQEAELLLLHLLTYLDERSPVPEGFGRPERDVVEDLARFLDGRRSGIAEPVDREEPRSGGKPRYDLVWRARGHRFPVEVERRGLPFTWAFSQLRLVAGPDEHHPVWFLLIIDDTEQPAGPVLFDDCVSCWPSGGGLVVGLRLRTAPGTTSRPVPPADDPPTPVHRVCIAVDGMGFGGLDDVQRAVQQRSMMTATREALEAAGTSVRACIQEIWSDGEIIVLPGGTDAAAVIPRFVEDLAQRLSAYNRLAAWPLRMRVAIGEEELGLIGDFIGGMEGTGRAVLHTARLLDSAALRDSMVTHPQAGLGLIVSQEIHQRVPALRGRLRRVGVPSKDQEVWGWLLVAAAEDGSVARLPDRNRSSAVLVGVGHYMELPDLPQVRTGLDALAALLTDPPGAFARDRTAVVSDPVSVPEVLEHLDLAARSAEDTLLVYFAGHSLRDPASGELSLAMAGTRQDRGTTALPFRFVREALRASRALHKIVILDCCDSGEAVRVTPSGDALDVREDTGDTLVLAASDRVAMAPRESTYTAFTGELIGLLSEGVSGGPEFLSMEELYRQLRQRLHAGNLPQPQMTSTHRMRQLVIARNRAHLGA
ncbi:caspase, EACC1-associated type [Streptomyces incarnatus]|uniref:caspase, EACC1-associated type n=1 Tax=Streptomyces incarnatus TaxID=665007 RepID=UPI001AD82435|nr:SAV_2336 N-terminal domain-related protein [Streptomyces incarnatus]